MEYIHEWFVTASAIVNWCTCFLLGIFSENRTHSCRWVSLFVTALLPRRLAILIDLKVLHSTRCKIGSLFGRCSSQSVSWLVLKNPGHQSQQQRLCVCPYWNNDHSSRWLHSWYSMSCLYCVHSYWFWLKRSKVKVSGLPSAKNLTWCRLFSKTVNKLACLPYSTV